MAVRLGVARSGDNGARCPAVVPVLHVATNGEHGCPWTGLWRAGSRNLAGAGHPDAHGIWLMQGTRADRARWGRTCLAGSHWTMRAFVLVRVVVAMAGRGRRIQRR
uniref:Uncharacterized protein n=1 Tax=Triticum urartu TaxID=4572 RepID=A0A8R7P230_TRIUA